jgi:hypothetical protein
MKLSKPRVLLWGILSPVLALILDALMYGTLTRYSADLEKDGYWGRSTCGIRPDGTSFGFTVNC